MNRERALRDGYDLVVAVMRLRPPQAEALRELRDALLRLPKPLMHCTAQERKEFLALKDGWKHPYHPSFTMALATGLGKTRLAGAIIALLWLTNEAKTFLILAPRRAVLRRFESAFDQRFREYLFVDHNLVPEPSVVRADEIDSPRAYEFQGQLLERGPKIFLLSPQLIASSDRFKRRPDFADCSPLEALRDRADLVVIADEAHHIGKLSSKETTAWADAIRQLEPTLQIGMTATPRREQGEHLLYEYSLQRALRDGDYTKSVHVCVRHFVDASLDQEDIDKSAIQYSLDRLDRKEEAVKSRIAHSITFPPTKPVCVFFARDIEHAEQVVDWVIATGRVSADELLLTHSQLSKSEAELERLLSIEDVSNPVRVVVNVMELTEGWDVTNVYVVTPLRAMATFPGALQAMGRGLRLPAGRRIGDPVLDELDVVCFGKEALEKIVREATDWSASAGHGGGVVKVTTFDKSDPVSVPVAVPAVATVNAELLFCQYEYVEEDLKLEIHASALSRVKEAVVTEVELSAAQTRLGFGKPKIERGAFIRATALRVIRSLETFLSDAKDFDRVSNLVRDWLESTRPGEQQVEFDPAEVGEEMARALTSGVKDKPAIYDVGSKLVSVTFPGYVGSQDVMVGPDAPVANILITDLPSYDGTSFIRKQLYRGWKKSSHVANSFDSEPEAMVARLLDRAPAVKWWVRNNPVRFKLETPAGEHWPDFIVCEKKGAATEMLILEAKGDHLWKEPTDASRLKAAAAKEWARAQSESKVEFAAGVALETDIRKSGSWAELKGRLQ